LINPPHVLDLDSDVSLAAAIRSMGRRPLLLDWGNAAERGDLDVTGHVTELLLPLIGEVGEPPALIGYCLGGTMALAAAGQAKIERVATLAAPWHFSRYPESARDAVGSLWRNGEGASLAFGAMPMELLQAAFWSVDPERTVTKFARFGQLEPASPQAQRFVALEDWANEGEPLPCPAARELIGDFFGKDRPGSGEWAIARAIAAPALHFTAARDRIAPAATAPDGAAVHIESGHVGMVVGSARAKLHDGLRRFLDPACR
jgi:polyhydroxyalkanoate synthase